MENYKIGVKKGTFWLLSTTVYVKDRTEAERKAEQFYLHEIKKHPDYRIVVEKH